MNIHPIFVHFPIAFLTVYAVCELIWIKRLRNNEIWQGIKAALLGFGILGAFVALRTGELVAETVGGGGNQLIATHSSWANITTLIFGFAALVYLIVYVERYFGIDISRKLNPAGWYIRVFNFKTRAAKIIWRSPFIAILALAGLIAVTITGALGAAMVYGPDTDPVVKIIYSFFFPQ